MQVPAGMPYIRWYMVYLQSKTFQAAAGEFVGTCFLFVIGFVQ